MTLTFIDLYNECAGQPWSMFDADAESADDLESALKVSINKATSYLWNLQPWSFRYETSTIKTRAGKNQYILPEGTLTRKVVNGTVKYGVKYQGKSLEYIEDPEGLEQESGEPTSFYLVGEYLYLYPMPDNVYQVTLEYLLSPYGLNDEEEYLYELKEEDDRINIPDKYETIFKNCLISLAMMYAIADENDENYSGYKKQYDDALIVLMKHCSDKLHNKRITW